MTFLKRKKIDISTINLKLRIVFFILFIGLMVLWIRDFYIQVVWRNDFLKRSRSQYWTKELVYGKRGEIFSSDNVILAKTIVFKSVFAVPDKLKDPRRVSLELARILNINRNYLLKRLSSKKKFVWIKRKVSDSQAQKISSLNIKGVYLTEESGRIYPQQIMAGQLIGFVGTDNRGLEGVEKGLDNILRGRKEYLLVQKDGRGNLLYAPGELDKGISGQDVVLTIDSRIQSVAERALARGVIKNKGKYGLALVVDVHTGNILAWAQYPFFNPNKFTSSSPSIWRDRMALDMFEPGSTMKPLMIAAAIQKGICDINKIYYCENGRWKLDNVIIRDAHPHGWLSVARIIRYSSNIGAAKIGLELGKENFYNYLKALGFGRTTNMPLPGEAKGILRDPKDWEKVDLATISFGQGISVTALQLVRAYLCIANYGVYKSLQLIPGENYDFPKKRIFSRTVCKAILSALKDVVEKDGTGQMARIPGIEIGGKTGTSQKIVDGKYSDKEYVASFIGLLPAMHPKYLAFCMVDEPKSDIYGGKVAAPIVKEIFNRLIPLESSISPLEVEYLSNTILNKKINNRKNSMSMPKVYNLSKIPNFKGMCLREVLEILSKKKMLPMVKGSGPIVVRQYPQAGSNWDSKKIILWMGFKQLSAVEQ